MTDKASFRRNQYCRRIENDSDDNIEGELLAVFNTLPAPEVTFLNFYKEVAIVSPVDLTNISDDSLTCKTTDIQCRAIATSNSTIIRSASLKHDVFAIASCRSDTNEIIISDLTYVEVYTDKRSSVRVKMDSVHSIQIEAGRNQFNGYLLELSLNGCAVAIPDRQLLENYKYFYLNIDIPFTTIQHSNSTRVMAKLIRCEQKDTNNKCIFVFEHHHSTEDQIGRVLAQRQIEIIRELK